MSTLASLQQIFQNELYDKPCKILPEITSNRDLTKHQQFALYQISIRARFLKALKNSYPVCVKLVGEEFFTQMAFDYILTTPSSFKDLNNYGASFPLFVQNFPAAKHLGYLTDMAKLDWAWYRLASAPLAGNFDFNSLAERSACAPSETLIFVLPERSTLLSSRYPIHEIWHAHQDSASDFAEMILRESSYYYFIWRGPDGMCIENLSTCDFQALTWIDEKNNMQILCENIATLYPCITPAEMLSQYIAKGWIANFE